MKTEKDILNQLKLNEREKLPDTYFDEFPAIILEKIRVSNEPEKTTTIRQIYRKPVFWFSIAATIAAVFVIGSLDTHKQDAISQLTAKEISCYLLEYIDDIDEEHLLPSTEDKELDRAGISKDEILEYIENEEVEIEF